MSSESVTPDARPYKGLESYQVEDSELFFGRDQEALHLVATILSARITIVHAPSGAGKTSLLNARIIPHLEARGWTPVRILPQNDPIESVRVTTLHAIAPAPETELQAFERALAGLVGAGEDLAVLSVRDLLDRYDALGVADRRFRELISPLQSPPLVIAGVLPPSGAVAPYFCRLLRRSVEISRLSEHLACLRGDGGEGFQIEETTSLSALRAALADPRLVEGHRTLLSRLYVPVPGLRQFFENLFDTYGSRLSSFAMVLIFDQFEEIFTRFVDPGPNPESGETARDLPDWRLRPRFFEELEDLAGPRPGRTEDQGELPIRFVISLREEYIARLEPIRLFAPEVDNSSYHLGFLELDSARAAIQSPATQYGYRYSRECLETILGQLTREDRFVQPSHLQIVCERLWSSYLHGAPGDGDEACGEAREIHLETLDALEGVPGILRSFLREYLERLPDQDRSEVLDLLEPLITSSRTRNIVESSVLVQAPFRDPAQRSRLLEQMIQRRLVRSEWRLGGYFVEITHEFLIGPILEAIRNEAAANSNYWRLREALRSLARLQEIDFRGPAAQLLSPGELQALHEDRERLRWPSRATELMLRSAVVHLADRSPVREWARRYEQSGEMQDAGDLLGNGQDAGREGLLSRDELRLVNERRGELPLGGHEIERILRSMLWSATAADRELIRYWAGRWIGT
jgi:hypothetical protein